MEAYSNSYSSSIESSYLTQRTHQAKSPKSNGYLHSVRKSQQGKPWKKAPVAPPPPTPVKVYKVDPVNFRDLVQQLTGAPEFKAPPHDQHLHHNHQFLQSVTPSPPINPMLSGRDIAASSTVSTNWYIGPHVNH